MTLSVQTAFRLLLDDPADGQRNMAVDEALLDAVGSGESPPTVRLYGFRPPTVSFGRFQRVREKIRWRAVREEGITLVRRPTGGQAVLHDKELTYCVVLARDSLHPFGKREIYRFIAGLLLEGLSRLGVRAVSSRHRSGDLHNPDCFRSTGEYEIASSAAEKLIGSAQLVNRRASLQHGAIPLDMSYRRIGRFLELTDSRDAVESSEASCLSREVGRPVGLQEALKAFAEGFDAGLRRNGIKLQTGALSHGEAVRVEELLERKYTGEEWNLQY